MIMMITRRTKTISLRVRKSIDRRRKIGYGGEGDATSTSTDWSVARVWSGSIGCRPVFGSLQMKESLR